MQRPEIPVVVRQARLECEGVLSFELEAAGGGTLPGYTAGAHVDVALPGVGMRSYSLIDAPQAQPRCWRIAVKKDAAGRGGSRWLHDQLRVGQLLQATAPANDFALAEDAAHSVLIAGGIGITPLVSMIGRLRELGRSWELHYAASSPGAMAFREQVAGNTTHYFSGASRMDIAALLQGAAPVTHFYCCGPASMIDAFVAAGAGKDPGTIHFERFAATQAAATDGGFTLQLARAGRSLPVPAGKTILDVLLDAGVDVPYSCTQGVCGTCRIPVLGGEPDHRDDYLTDDERAANDCIIACRSGARSATLALDL